MHGHGKKWSSQKWTMTKIRGSSTKEVWINVEGLRCDDNSNSHWKVGSLNFLNINVGSYELLNY